MPALFRRCAGIGTLAPVLAVAACHAGPMPVEVENAGWRAAARAGDLLPLEVKERRITRRLVRRHLTEEGLYAYRVPLPFSDSPEAEPSDTAAWTALWAVAETLRTRVTGHAGDAARRNALLRGLDHLARVSGHHGVLARTMVAWSPARIADEPDHPRHWERGDGQHAGVDYSRFAWKTDNSKDLVVCWTLAMTHALQDVRDEELLQDLAADLLVVEDRIARADFVITEADGTPVRFGDLHPAGEGAVRQLLRWPWSSTWDIVPGLDFAIGPNAVMSAALVRAADAARVAPRWPLLRSQGWLGAIADGVYHPVHWTHYNNDFLAAVALWSLHERGTAQHDPRLDEAVREAMATLWAHHRHDRSPFWIGLAWRLGVLPERERGDRLREALVSLAVMPTEGVVRSIDQRELPGLQRRWWRRDHAAHALPPNLQTSSSNQWKTDPTRILRHVPNAGTQVHGRMDFLLGWWLLRWLHHVGCIDDATWVRARLEVERRTDEARTAFRASHPAS